MSLLCRIRFHGSLAYFLQDGRSGAWIEYALDGRVAVKHAVEALGVPHVEVAQIVVDSRSVPFSHILAHGEDVDVYPLGYETSTDNRVCLREPMVRPLRFVLDTHLGRLAAYLRMLGYDTVYGNDVDDAELAEISAREGRLLLTRDRGLLKRKAVVYGYSVRDTQPRAQLAEVAARYELGRDAEPWSRCVRCNGVLESVEKADILVRLEPMTRQYYEDFSQCTSCGKIYWRGSHFERMQACLVDSLGEPIAGASAPDGDFTNATASDEVNRQN